MSTVTRFIRATLEKVSWDDLKVGDEVYLSLKDANEASGPFNVVADRRLKTMENLEFDYNTEKHLYRIASK